MRETLQLTEENGYEALQGHVVDKALAARTKYGPEIDWAAMLEILKDPEFVRFPVGVRFDDEALLNGEFAYAAALGKRPSDGFCLFVHPCFQSREDVLPMLVAYHVPAINYLDIATHKESELFGATLLGLRVDEYYETLCDLADSMPGGVGRVGTEEIRKRFEALTAEHSHAADPMPGPANGAGGCGTGCGCA